jgi:putative copper export protein
LTVIALTLSAAGHAGDDGVLSLANLADWLHIMGAFLWGGGILATAAIIFPLLLNAPQPERELAAFAGLRLSTLAGIALGLVLVSGMYNAWLQVGTWHGLWSTLYGRLLVAKLLLVAGMMALGAVNRYRYVPALQRHAGRPEPRMLVPVPGFLRSGNEGAAASHFLRSLWVEALLLVGVLILAAALSQQTPAAHAEHDDMPEHMHSDT